MLLAGKHGGWGQLNSGCPQVAIALPTAFSGSSGALLTQEDSWISNFTIAGGWYYLALAISPTASTNAAGSKNVPQGCYTSRSYCSQRMEKYTNLC
jgi:hypothetical protein